MKLGKRLRKILSFVLVAVCVAVPVAVVSMPVPVYAEGMDTSTITEWLPIIIQFAMLGMVMGLLKKFGRS